MSLYNKLKALQVIPDAKTLWQEYRMALTHHIIETTLSNTTLAIWGAGACNDIDLEQLAKHFSKITLIDRDLIAMDKAIKSVNLSSDILQCVKKDFMHISEQDYDMFEKRMRTINEEDLEPFLMDVFSKVIRLEKDPLRLQFEYALCSGVHSQLLSMFHWLGSLILEERGLSNMTLSELISYFNLIAAKQLNDQLLQCTKKSVFIGLEEKRVGREGAIEGAWQAHADLEKRIRQTQISCEQTTSFTWPFNIKNQVVFELKLFEVQGLKTCETHKKVYN